MVIVTSGMDNKQLPSSSISGAKKPASQSLHSSDKFIGKHRMAVVVARLDQQIQIVQEELKELDTMDPSSTSCKEIISSIDSVPDALLPITRGPADDGWERWFRGAHGPSRSHNKQRM